MSYTLRTQEYPTSMVEEREAESLRFCISIGERGGFYKVQIVDNDFDSIIYEFKNEPEEINEKFIGYAKAGMKCEEVNESAKLFKSGYVEFENKNNETISLEIYIYKHKSGRFGWNTKPEHVKSGYATAYQNFYAVSIADKFKDLRSCIDDITDHLAYRYDVLRSVSGSVLMKKFSEV